MKFIEAAIRKARKSEMSRKHAALIVDGARVIASFVERSRLES